MRRILAALLVVLAAPVALAADPPAVKLEIVEPQKGKTYDGSVPFHAKFNGGPNDRDKIIIVRCFDATHHLRVGERVSLLGQMPDVDLRDDYLSAKPGEHTMAVSVWVEDKPDALHSVEVKFRVAEPKAEPDQEKLDRIRSQIYSARAHIWGAEEQYRSRHRWVKQGGPAEELKKAEDAVHRARVDDLFGRLRAYSSLAEFFEQRFETDRALRALNFAREIFLQDKDNVGVHPKRPGATLFVDKVVCDAPAHFVGFARYHTRRNDIEGAVSAWERQLQWYEKQLERKDLDEKQRHRCAAKAREACHEMAFVHVLLRNDKEEWATCMERARKIKP